MKTLVLAVMAAVVVASPALAATVIEPLRSRSGSGAAVCTADRVWCVTPGEGRATVRHRDAGDVGNVVLETNEDERVESALWRSIVRIREPGRGEVVLLGVARTERESYSGGGGSVTTLKLIELRANASQKPQVVLDVPLASSFLIRACFTRADERQRRGVCHDEYRYRASLRALPRGSLVYKARADSYPGPRRRFDDSTGEGRLRKADLYRAIDRRCTFTRELMRNAGTGAFAWSAPPAACADYLELQ